MFHPDLMTHKAELMFSQINEAGVLGGIDTRPESISMRAGGLKHQYRSKKRLLNVTEIQVDVTVSVLYYVTRFYF